MLKITQIRAEIDDDIKSVEKRVKKELEGFETVSLVPVKKALDARRKNDIHYVWAFEAELKNEDKFPFFRKKNISKITPNMYAFPNPSYTEKPIVVAGAGPAGLFAALMLARAGCRVILLERGKAVEERQKDVESFAVGGVLDPESNVQFGEGGAGTFSDGKLTTGIKDPRIKTVLEEFVRFGAPEEIMYLSKPHIGTDKLRGVVKGIREEIIRLGGEVRFETKLSGIISENGSLHGIETNGKNGNEAILTERLILACGHSARDTFEMLKKSGIQMEQKPFSVGARMEHPQELIGRSQYGEMFNRLPAADYKLAVHLSSGRGVYTFCMCPGGEVIASASEKNTVVTNGMSYYARNGKNANAALLVSVNPNDFGSNDVLAGIEFQRKIEKLAFAAGGGDYKAPCQRVEEFLKGTPSSGAGAVIPTYRPGVKWTDISGIFPDFVTESMREGILLMDKKLSGFAHPDAVLTAPETRSSSPVRLVRDKETFQLNIKGIFSAGEGGGHAGGITSAAVDGIKAAEKACTL